MVRFIRLFYVQSMFEMGEHHKPDDPPLDLTLPATLVSKIKYLDLTLTTFYFIRFCRLAVNQDPETLARFARYDPLACVLERTNFDSFSMVAMVLLMTYSLGSQIMLLTSDKTKVTWQILYDMTIRLTDLYYTEPYVTKSNHNNSVVRLCRKSTAPSTVPPWYVRHLTLFMRDEMQLQRRLRIQSQLKWIATNRWLRYLDSVFPQFCGYTRLVNFALSTKRLRYYPNLTATAKFLLMIMMTALEAFFEYVTVAFVLICIYNIILGWILFRIYFPIYYTPMMILDFILTSYAIYVHVVRSSHYIVLSCFMIVYAHTIQLRQLNSYLRSTVRSNIRLVAIHLRVLRYFNLEHTRLVYYTLVSNRHFYSYFIFISAVTIAPVNIIFLDILYFTKQLSPEIRALFVTGFSSQAFFGGFCFLPMVYMGFQMHNSRKYFIPLQLKLPRNQLSAKIKTMLLYERIESEKTLTFTMGSISTVTGKSFLGFIGAYISYLLLAGSFMIANKY